MKRAIVILGLFLIMTAPVSGEEATEPARNRSQIRQELRDLREERIATFKERVQQIKDKNKQKIAERINNQLAQINQLTTQAFEQHLTTIQNLLNKIIVWKDKAKTEGKDTSAAETAITQAQTAITNAQTAVEEQKLKEYVIEFSEESGLRVGASQAKTSLRTDLKAVREKVKAARQAVVDSLKAVKEEI